MIFKVYRRLITDKFAYRYFFLIKWKYLRLIRFLRKRNRQANPKKYTFSNREPGFSDGFKISKKKSTLSLVHLVLVTKHGNPPNRDMPSPVRVYCPYRAKTVTWRESLLLYKFRTFSPMPSCSNFSSIFVLYSYKNCPNMRDKYSIVMDQSLNRWWFYSFYKTE